jgi:hypothetical protein
MQLAMPDAMLTRAAGDDVQRFVELSKNVQFSR